jgi:hypothetical protein
VSLNKALLPPIMQSTMETVQKLSNCPDEMAIQNILAVANFACQPLANVDPVAFGIKPISEYFVIIAPTTAKKSTIFKMLTKGVNRYMTDKIATGKEDAEKYLVQFGVYKKDLAAAIKETENYKNTPLVVRPQKPEGFEHIITTGTTNGVLNALDNVSFIGLFNDEAGNFLNSHSFSKAGSSKEMSTMLTLLWEGETVSRRTGIKEDTITLRNKRFNALLCMQPSIAGDLFNNDSFKNQGFLNRFLVVQVPNWIVPDMDGSQKGRIKIDTLKAALEPWHQHIYGLLNKRKTFVDLNGQSVLNEIQPPTLKWGDKALETAMDIGNIYKNNTGDGQAYVEEPAFATRMFEHLCRLAGTLAVFESHTSISVDNVMAAENLMQMYYEQITKIDIPIAVIGFNIPIEAEKVVDYLKKKGPTSHNALTKVGPTSYRRLTILQREAVISEALDREMIEAKESVLPNKNKLRIYDIAT